MIRTYAVKYKSKSKMPTTPEKIAELEEEEKRNKAQEVSHQEIKPTPPIDNVKPLETTPVVENKTNVNNLELSDDESDDDFFDDFFDN